MTSPPKPSRSKWLRYAGLLLVIYFAFSWGADFIETFKAMSAELHKRGYCISQKRFVDDNEKIRAAIQYIINTQRVVSYDEQSKKYVEHQDKEIGVRTADRGLILFKIKDPYKSIDDFLERNPDCCKITKRYFVIDDWKAREPNFEDLVWGYNLDLIEMQYSVHYFDDEGNVRSTMRQDNYTADPCGRWGGLDFQGEPVDPATYVEKPYGLEHDPIIQQKGM